MGLLVMFAAVVGVLWVVVLVLLWVVLLLLFWDCGFMDRVVE